MFLSGEHVRIFDASLLMYAPDTFVFLYVLAAAHAAF